MVLRDRQFQLLVKFLRLEIRYMQGQLLLAKCSTGYTRSTPKHIECRFQCTEPNSCPLGKQAYSQDHELTTGPSASSWDRCLMQDSACHLSLGLRLHHQVPNLAYSLRGQGSYLLGNSGRCSICGLHRLSALSGA